MSNRATIIVKKTVLKQISDGYISSPEVPMDGFSHLRWALRLYRNPNDTLFQPVLWISPNRDVRLFVCASLFLNSKGGHACGHTNETEEHSLTDPLPINEIGNDGHIYLSASFGNTSYLKISRPLGAFGFDIHLLVGSTETSASRHLLSLLSPVFKSMLQKVPMKTENSQLEIKGHTIQAVQTVIDFINGYPNQCGNELEAFKFAVEYDMKTVSDHFGQVIVDNFSEHNFCEVAEIAWELNHDALKKQCAEFYRKNLAVTLKPAFVRLQVDTKDELIRMASDAAFV